MFADLVVSDLGVIARAVVALLGSLCQHNYLVQHLLLSHLICVAKLIVRVKFVIELVPERRPRKLLFCAQLALTVGDSLLLDYTSGEKLNVRRSENKNARHQKCNCKI